MAGGALCLPPRPLHLPLLFPKNLASLRFSGALFFCAVEWVSENNTVLVISTEGRSSRD